MIFSLVYLYLNHRNQGSVELEKYQISQSTIQAIRFIYLNKITKEAIFNKK